MQTEGGACLQIEVSKDVLGYLNEPYYELTTAEFAALGQLW